MLLSSALFVFRLIFCFGDISDFTVSALARVVNDEKQRTPRPYVCELYLSEIAQKTGGQLVVRPTTPRQTELPSLMKPPCSQALSAPIAMGSTEQQRRFPIPQEHH